MARNGDVVYEIGGDASSLIAAGEAGAKAMRGTDKAVQDLKKQLERLGTASSSYQRQLNAAIGVNENFAKSAKASAAVFSRDWDKAVGQVDRLRSQLDPLYASSMRYQAALEQLDAAMKRGVITQAEHARLLDLAGQSYLQSGNAAVVSAGKMGGLSGIMSRNGSTIQMFGYQVQDAAVQLSMGTNAMTVFAQQGSQMASAFGPYGALFGALAAVTLPLLGAAFMSTGEKAKSFSDTVTDLESAVQRVDEVIRTYSIAGLEELRQKYGEVDAAVLAMTERQKQFAVDQASQAAVEAVTKLANEYGVLGIKLSDTGLAASSVRTKIAGLADELGLSTAQTRELVAAMQNAARAKDELARANALAVVADLLMKSTRASDELTGKIIDAEAAMRRLAASVPGAGWLSGMISEASTLGAQLWDAVSARAALAAEAFVDDAGNIIPAGVSRGARPKAAPTGVAGEDWGGGGRGGGGGGGGGQDQTAADLERLQEQLMSEAELQLKHYEEQQLLLEQALQKKLLTTQEYNALMEQAQQDHQDAMTEIDVWRYGDGLAKTEAFMGGMADALQSGNERMQRIGRIFGAAEALINAWRAYNQTMADPSLPFFAKLPAALSVLAAGMNAVNAIKGGGSGGGGGRGSSRGSTGAAQPQQATPLSVRLTEFNPNGLYSGAVIDNLLDSLTKAAGDRGYRLMVAR